MTAEPRRTTIYRWSLATLSWYVWLVVFGLSMFIPDIHPTSILMGVWLVITTVARAFGY